MRRDRKRKTRPHPRIWKAKKLGKRSARKSRGGSRSPRGRDCYPLKQESSSNPRDKPTLK